MIFTPGFCVLCAGGCDGHAKEWPRGATPHPRSGAEAGRTPYPKGGGQEELLHVRGQGGAAERRYPASEVRGDDERSYPASEVRGGSREEIPHAPKP